ncbi:hypothetical protein BV96_04574 [Sphingomonas paucimobilis]|nr:hypothetical protein BV96_04574 [Sphingomonas paucimobilis]
MRTQLGFHIRASRTSEGRVGGDQVDVVLVEEAILQRDVDVVGYRIANASERLPGEAGVGIVHQIVGQLGARNADTATDKALKAIVSTEIQKAVQHERQGRGRTTEVALVEINLGALVAGFGFQTETTEVIADHRVAVPTLVVIHVGDSHARGEFNVLIFDKHDAGVDTDVPAVITRQGRGGQGAGRKRSREGKLPHLDSPFKSVTKDC